METWTREQIKADPVMSELLRLILSKHTTPGHTVKNLLELQHVPNVCELTTRFVELPATENADAVYLSYEFNSWISVKPEGIIFPTRVESITLYETFIEYESTRIKDLSGAAPEDRDNSALNLN